MVIVRVGIKVRSLPIFRIHDGPPLPPAEEERHGSVDGRYNSKADSDSARSGQTGEDPDVWW